MRSLLVVSLIFAVILISLKVGLSLMTIDSALVSPGLSNAQEVVDSVSSSAWEFGKPLLQLIVVLALGEWFVSRLGLKVSSIGFGSINIQTFIAIAIVFTFCLAILASLPGIVEIKEIVLIVIGFYFGTKSQQVTEQDVMTRPETEAKQQ
ncbi:MAG: hypothetical protein KA144_05465 [Xanthomonadaceae bacterium]|nr:hypothetical protein [Xanthomonadaceae bacterium]